MLPWYSEFTSNIKTSQIMRNKNIIKYISGYQPSTKGEKSHSRYKTSDCGWVA